MYTLRLDEDRLTSATTCPLPAQPRILYVREGDITVATPSRSVRIGADSAWHGTGACTVTAGAGGALVLRYELIREAGPATPTASAGRMSRPLLVHAIDLDPSQSYLLRCDRVDFAPGGEALPHGHKGGGIRCLIAGELEVRVGAEPGKLLKPGDAWFESGREPVHAIASKAEPTGFIRVSVLPRAIQGQSSIVYVNPAHASVKPRKYTVYVDEPFEIG